MSVARPILFYQLSLTSFHFPRAMLGVLFPYLVTVYLAESPKRVSYAMTASMLPNLFVLLFAGALADRLNKRKLLGISSTLFLVGITTSLRLPDTPALTAKDRPSILSEIPEGLALVLSSKTLRLPVFLMSSAGLILGGPYAVLVPLMLRDTYHATGFDFAFAFAVFMVGGACSSGMLLKLGAIRNPVPLLVVGYSMGSFALLFWAMSPPYWAFLGSIFFWGVGGGICLNMSRTILQEQAPSTHKSRVLSVMYLGDEGGAPVGSLITGVLITTFSLSSASIIPGVVVLLISLLLLLVLSAQRSEAKATQDVGQ
ncbi:MFS transporter [Pseudovibrio sp. Alg231-02]|uniref:MFS transporter n=1 Tax=Pseudovibrio sp. Alg231-02 TaxID=1922223 RepID=UPI000D54CB74|nr:MFS transporter [Pseudovibrio sp. Alg231-02]